LGHPSLTPDLRAYFRSAPVSEFSGTVYRIRTARYGIRGYFGTLYPSLSKETARREMARYFTVPPKDGFVEASILLRLSRVLDLTNRRLLRKAGVAREQLIGTRYSITGDRTAGMGKRH